MGLQWFKRPLVSLPPRGALFSSLQGKSPERAYHARLQVAHVTVTHIPKPTRVQGRLGGDVQPDSHVSHYLPTATPTLLLTPLISPCPSYLRPLYVLIPLPEMLCLLLAWFILLLSPSLASL